MNRRLLKFRAWDPISKRMYPEFYLFGETTCFDLISQWLMEVTPEASSLMRMNDAVITQYTGLQDSKGKDIFDGDIVSGICLNEGPNICVVGFDAFGIFYTKIKMYPCEDYENVAILAQEYNEVIGNIFENPELLQT